MVIDPDVLIENATRVFMSLIATLSTHGSAFARLVLNCINREYPNKIEHLLNGPGDARNPGSLHPAFYGCFDWHSSVHGHWLLVHLLRLFPQIPEGGQIRSALNNNLSDENIRVEAEYFKQEGRTSFERMYGWAWLLKLAEELHLWHDADGQRWSDNLQPLVETIAERYFAFLPRQTYPIRTGVHANTAFGLSFALDYARTLQNQELTNLFVERSGTYFLADSNYPAHIEPGGEDFLSPSLIEADLMCRVLLPADFADWFHRFLPRLAEGEPKILLHPAMVSDRTDPKIVHLDGLNLSRAWCMRNIAAALPSQDPVREILTHSAEVHAQDGLAHVTSGNYEGEHWLATFATYLLSTPISF
ncbi:MAG: hypothetical protein QOE77_3945 [Blastocatellia bacterium]|nr:hypothetical protein [Blastocatellia bacterium]